MIRNKKAQISELMTWVVATIAIIFILIIFIYASSIFAQKTKTVDAKNLRIDLGKGTDLLEVKTNIAYFFSSQEQKNIIDAWRQKQ